MGGGIPLPALDVHVPQFPDSGEAIGRLVQMKGLLNQQEIQKQQLQASTLENQQRQMDLQDQQNMRSLAPQFIKKDDSGKASGFDSDGYFRALTGAGVNPQKIATMQKAQNDAVLSKAQAGKAALDLEDAKNDQAYQVLESVRSAAKDPKATPDTIQAAYQSGLARLGQLGIDTSKFTPQYPGDQALTDHEVGLGVHKQIIADAKTQAETDKDTQQAAEAKASAAKSQAETTFYANNPSAGAPGVPAETVSLMDYMRKPRVPGEPMHTPSNYPAWKARQEAAATEPYKIETAAAEGKARQLIQGMAEPVYAMDADGKKTLMSKTAALQSGAQTILPVNEKQVSEDTMLINRLGDVRQKIARYDQALQGWLGQGNVANKEGEKSSMAGLLSSDKLKVGAFGVELPVDRLNQLADQFGIKTLSPQARDAVIAYYNARESLVGYNRVLSGSGRSSETALELQMQTLPSPVSADADYARRSIGQFKENLQIVGQGLPKIPGVKSPEEWEEKVTKSTQAAPPAGATHIAPGKDGKNHYTNATGTVDLGIAP